LVRALGALGTQKESGAERDRRRRVAEVVDQVGEERDRPAGDREAAPVRIVLGDGG